MSKLLKDADSLAYYLTDIYDQNRKELKHRKGHLTYHLSANIPFMLLSSMVVMFSSSFLLKAITPMNELGYSTAGFVFTALTAVVLPTVLREVFDRSTGKIGLTYAKKYMNDLIAQIGLDKTLDVLMLRDVDGDLTKGEASAFNKQLKELSEFYQTRCKQTFQPKIDKIQNRNAKKIKALVDKLGTSESKDKAIYEKIKKIRSKNQKQVAGWIESYDESLKQGNMLTSYSKKFDQDYFSLTGESVYGIDYNKENLKIDIDEAKRKKISHSSNFDEFVSYLLAKKKNKNRTFAEEGPKKVSLVKKEETQDSDSRLSF